ncbi:phosphatidic acid phosphatase type 2D [Electrophorus electricus]|uniref:Phosphatidic acid phosphatase type 2/haloperoxidase domain-containing protein n=1 Tax=Electrophorus electricus TaxID=8005 RepID=A0A4W4EU50_ELEEL|nr:phosphatidic acid phosphatase type 2D [Electrophorus electricus]
MQKVDSASTPTGHPDSELQQRLSDYGGAREGMRENGKHVLGREEPVEAAYYSNRKMLVGLDIVCLFVASIPFFACELKAVKPYYRGFFCGDSTITYPYVESEAIPDSMLIAGGIIITGFAIALGECYRVRMRRARSRAFVGNLYVACLYKELGSFLFGCCIGQSLTNMAKLSVGRLRPNFLSVCNVTYTSLGCTPGKYIDQVICSSTPKEEEEARKSFFSGHASFAMYTMLYLAFYLQARLSWRGARLLRPLLQFLLVMLAVYTGLTRISDYRHHPTDVLTGFLQGALTAYWVAFHISSMFKTGRQASVCVSLDSPMSLSSGQTSC